MGGDGGEMLRERESIALAAQSLEREWKRERKRETHTHARTHARTHAHTHTNTHTHTHTHTHTQSLALAVTIFGERVGAREREMLLTVR